jgi:hypothetical protein
MKKKLNIVVATAIGVGALLGAASGATAGAQGGIGGDLCTVKVGNTFMYHDQARLHPFANIFLGEQFRAHSYSPNRTVAYGHSTSTFPTDGWVSKYDLAC